jgi:hypothetical protein
MLPRAALTALLILGAASWTRADGEAAVEFNTAKSSFVCYDKTPPEFAKTNPMRKIIEASIRVSANFNVAEQEVERIEYRLKMPDGFEVVDYLPKTTVGSEVAALHVGGEGSDRSVKIVALEGGASAGFRVPTFGVEGKAGAERKTEDARENRSSVEIDFLPPKKLITAANTEDDGRVLHFKLQQRDQDTLQGDKDYVLLAEAPKDWTGDCFTLECTAYRKGSREAAVARSRQVGLYVIGDLAARARVDQVARSTGSWRDLQPRAVPPPPVVEVPVPAPGSSDSAAVPPLKEGQLPIDGTWTTKFSLNGTPLPEVGATVRNGELHVDGTAKPYWKNLKLLSNHRYSATRVEKGIVSDYLHQVEFLVDDDGVLRQDDSNLAVLYRSIGKVTFVFKTLDDSAQFNHYHKK